MGFESGSALPETKLFTGLVDVSVVAVCPTKEEAEKLGINMKNDPVYVSVDSTTNNRKVRIDIYVKSETLNKIDKIAFFMEETHKVSSSGNNQYINDFGQSTWASTPEEATSRVDSKGNKWYKEDGIRLAYSGEVELVEFIINLLSIGRGQIAKLDNPVALFSGNVSEIVNIFKKFHDRKIQVLYIVRENEGIWYQGIYGRYFSRAGNKVTKWWEKHFTGNTNLPNHQNSYSLQEFNPLNIEAVEDKPVDDASKSIWGV